MVTQARETTITTNITKVVVPLERHQNACFSILRDQNSNYAKWPGETVIGWATEPGPLGP